MPIQNTVRCFAQIERSEAAIDAATESKKPVWLLFFESDQPASEVTELTAPGWRDWDSVLNRIDKLMRQRLLTVLHTGRFLGDDAGRLERFRNRHDLNRSLLPRLEKLDTVQLVVTAPAWESVISVRKFVLQTRGPLTDRKLRVAANSVSRSPRTVPGDEAEPTGWIDSFAANEIPSGRIDFTES
jgi:hypothetical protein